MIGSLPQVLYLATIAYALVGLVVATAFLLCGLDRLDPAAHGSIAFRPLIVPGLALLWPCVLLRWRRGLPAAPVAAAQRRQRAAHATVWLALAMLLPMILLGGFVLRQGGPLEAPAVRLAPPTP